MFEYFPGNYSWNLALNMALGMGGQIGEVDDACRVLQPMANHADAAALEEWYQVWARLGDRLAGLAESDEREGYGFSAGRKYLRSAAYYLTSERMMSSKDSRRLNAYQRMLTCFRKGITLKGDPVESIEIPFEGTSLPALFVPAATQPAPCMIHFDGLDVMKELLYMSGLPDDLRRRGISTLIVDHPGAGEALRLRNLHAMVEMEKPAGAAVDYLETRPEVMSDRIGIIALSLGGYYAPRAAAFEQRLKCCVAWGAVWDWYEVRGKRALGDGAEPSVSNFAEHVCWVFGVDSFDEAMTIAKGFTLETVADKIRCPLLVVHGANDRQIPLWTAHRTYDAAINSVNKKLKVLSLAEGGSEHCSIDNWPMSHDVIANWIADTLGGRNQDAAVVAASR